MSFVNRRGALSARGTGFLSVKGRPANGGRLYATGKNAAGNLGLGDTTDRNNFTQVGTDNDWAFVSSGTGFAANQMFTIALKANGTLWATGYNGNGQLGIGNTTNQTSFVQIGTDNNWAYIAAGLTGVLAVKTNGTLWAWGSNALFKFGLPTTANYTSPTQVGTATDWSKVATSGYTSLAIKTDGTLWGVGRNETGKLGAGNYTSRTTWAQIGSDTDWKNIKMSDSTSVAQKTNGYLYSTGYNIIGYLGIGENNPTLCTVTASNSATNEFTCDSTANLVAYVAPNFAASSIMFKGTVFGGVSAEGTGSYVYSVKSITSGTTFTISQTSGGTTFPLSTATGSMIVKGAYVNTWTQVTPNYDWKDYSINQNIIWALDPTYNQYYSGFGSSEIPISPANTVYSMTNASLGTDARKIALSYNAGSLQVENDGYAYVYGTNTDGMLDTGANVGAYISTLTQVSSYPNVLQICPAADDPVSFIIAP